MAAEVGGRAPDAQVWLRPKQPVQLRDLYRGTTVLHFYPLAFSATCTEQLCTAAAELPQYALAGANVYGLSVDSPWVSERYALAAGVPFPLLSDFNREAAAAFGVLREELLGLRGVSERAVFVIDEAVVIRYAWVADDPDELPPAGAIIGAARAAAGS